MNDIDSIDSETVRPIQVERLRLDDANPRLPESRRGQTQSEILDYLYRHGVLGELAQSYVDNGFFQHEPLIVVPGDESGSYTVIEGNRRLAALEILHGLPEAGERYFPGIDPSAEQLRALARIPCLLVSGRDKVHAYIGFRHIGGLKTWPPEAKARYILTEARRLVEEGSPDPFRELGRRVGSNAQGVRNPYLAIRILSYAREEFGLDVGYVQESRFGVWLRCMNSGEIRAYIGLDRARTYDEIEETLGDIDKDRLAEVLRDLEPPPGRARAVLGDSREVTAYGRVLGEPRARTVLRETKNLSLAKQVVDDLDLEAQARRLAESVRIFVENIQRAEPEAITNGLLEATRELSNFARSAPAIVKGRMESDDDAWPSC